MDLMLATSLRALMVRRTWNKFRHVLTDDSFGNANASAIYELLKELHAANKRNVTEHALRVAMEATNAQEDRREELTGVIDRIMEIGKDDLEDAEHAIRTYAARGYGDKAATYWMAHRNDATLDYGVPARAMAQAQRIVQETGEAILSSRQVGLPGDDDMVRVATSLGYSPELDAALCGGIGRGELAVLLAPPKRGKTSYLISAATTAVKNGEHVAYFTMEIARRKVFLRYFQTLTGMTYTELLANKQLVGARRAQVKGELHVIDCSMSRLTPGMVESTVEQMREDGIPISYVITDYLELMHPTEGFGKQGRTPAALGEMCIEMRRVGARLDVFNYTAWQVTRIGADKGVFGTVDISECWEVIKHADTILGQNQGPQELANNIMRLKVLEQRESPERPLIYLHSDMTRNVIRKLELTEGGSGYAEEVKSKTSSRNRSGARVHGSSSSD